MSDTHKILVRIPKDKKHLLQAFYNTLNKGRYAGVDIINSWGYTLEQRAEAEEFIEKLAENLKEHMYGN